MTPEELARVKIDKQLNDAGWDIVSRIPIPPINEQLRMVTQIQKLFEMVELKDEA